MHKERCKNRGGMQEKVDRETTPTSRNELLKFRQQHRPIMTGILIYLLSMRRQRIAGPTMLEILRNINALIGDDVSLLVELKYSNVLGCLRLIG